MKMPRFYVQSDGEWIEPKKGYLMACCDCSLVHRMEFRIVKGSVQFRAWRNTKITDERRKAENARIIKKYGLGLRSKKKI